MDYGYPNARIRGMKSRLLNRRALEDLISRPDVDALIVELEKTPYKEDIAEASTKYSGIYCIEYALRRNFTRTFRKILKIVRGERAETYIRIFLHRWDIQNIKTILRGKNFHESPDTIFECLVPAGDLDDVTLGEMIKQPDVRAVIDLLATWEVEYAKPLTRHYAEYADERDLIVLDSALDRFYYDKSLEAVRRNTYDENLIRELLTTEIDVINIKTVLRMLRDRIEPSDAARYLLEGGKLLRMKHLKAMLAAKTLEEAVGQSKGAYTSLLKAVPEEFFKHEKISEFEKRLDRYLISKGLNAYNGNPLSIAIAVGYYWMKLNELTNIRIISRCKTTDMSEESLREELFYV